jgi:hypothetical protein
MYRSKLIYSVAAIILFAAGFLFSFWPLCLLGLLLAAFTGQYVTAVLIGLLLDALYGAPVGRLHMVPVPFTLLAFITSALYYYLSAYFREGNTGTL